jgi:ABC-type multidrug transport system permease subunit
MKDIIYEQYKNFKILFRNLSSVLLLVIGPLFLILLIGFAYSGQSIHSIRIGVISPDYASLGDAFANFSSFSDVSYYNNTENCIIDIREQKTHLCLEFSREFAQSGGEELPSGSITFFFDNSKRALANKVVETVSSYFGMEAEKISIDSATTIFTNIQNLVLFLGQKNQDILLLVNESENIRSSLVERHESLIRIRSEFLPVYENIKLVQEKMDNLSQEFDSNYQDNRDASQELLTEIIRLRSFLISQAFGEFYFFFDGEDYALTQNYSLDYYNLSQYNYTISDNMLVIEFNSTNISIDLWALEEAELNSLMFSSLLLSLDLFENSVYQYSNSSADFYIYLHQQKMDFDRAVYLLDQVKITLDEDIDATEEYIEKIDVATERIQEIHDELDRSLKGLTSLDPSLAEKLVRPILKNYEPLLPGIENIKLAFPQMLAIIIIFISILFANIVTLAEVNSKAFYRNLLAPVSSLLFVSGLVITNIIVVFSQLLVLLLVGQFRFDIDIFSVFLPVAAIIVITSLFFICIGMTIAILLKNVQTSILTTTFAALAFFLFSDAVTPLETMPIAATQLASINPFVLASLAFKKLLVLGLPFMSLQRETGFLLAYLVIGICLLLLVSISKLNNKV